MVNIGIIIGSTRPGRLGAEVANWVYESAKAGGLAEYALFDIAEFGLPVFDEVVVPMVAPGVKSHTKNWARAIDSVDGLVFVTPEYNHGIPGPLKNAIDFLYAEWTDKAAGFVGYGANGGVRAVEHLRGVMAMLRVATVAPQVALDLATDFRNYSEFTPADGREGELAAVLSDVVSWGGALKTVRTKSGAID